MRNALFAGKSLAGARPRSRRRRWSPPCCPRRCQARASPDDIGSDAPNHDTYSVLPPLSWKRVPWAKGGVFGTTAAWAAGTTARAHARRRGSRRGGAGREHVHDRNRRARSHERLGRRILIPNPLCPANPKTPKPKPRKRRCQSVTELGVGSEYVGDGEATMRGEIWRCSSRRATGSKSAVCDTQVVVVRAPADPVELEIGGHAALPIDADAPGGAALDPAHSNGTQAGKRYADEAIGIEMLVTKPGTGIVVDCRRTARSERGQATPRPRTDDCVQVPRVESTRHADHDRRRRLYRARSLLRTRARLV